MLDAGYAPRRVAVVAHWSAVPTVSRSVEALVGELAAAGYDVIVSSAAECSGPLQWRDLPPEVSVFRRPNLGYDFGSWAQILELLPRVRSAEVALLVNDSLVGPFRPLAPLLAQMEADSAPVWGLVSTTQDAPHLQSHFIAYKSGVLESRRLRRFWSDVRIENSKRRIVDRYEVGLARELRRGRIPYSSGFDWRRVVLSGGNPTSSGWRRLLLWGFPFIKRELVLHPPPEVADAGDIPAVVKSMFGQDVMEWV